MKKGIFAGMDEDSFAKLQKIVTDSKKETKKKKHKNKRKGRFDFKTNRPGKRK